MRLVGPLPDFLTRCIARFREERCAQAAASLAFTTLLALVPLITVALVLISQFDLFSGLGAALRNFLLANLLPEKAGKVIATYALQFSQKTGRLTVLGTGMLVVTALLLMLSIDRVLGAAHEIPMPGERPHMTPAARLPNLGCPIIRRRHHVPAIGREPGILE